MHLDALDAAILRALLADARLSLRAVARQVGSTPTTVGERLRRLEEAGLIRGATLRLDDRLAPGRLRLARARVNAADKDEVLAVAARVPGVLEVLAPAGGRLLVVLAVRDLEDEERVVAALAAAGLTHITLGAVDRVAGPPAVHLFADAARVAEPCAVCGRETTEPITRSIDGRRVVFCCPSCEARYDERYAALRAQAGTRP